jgi:hypothetical protein
VQVGSDAERSSAIQALERALAAQEPSRQAAALELQQARQAEAQCASGAQAARRQVTAAASNVVGQCQAVYLDGILLDRGTVQVGREHLRFRGWYGGIEIPLAAIGRCDAGRSHLPPRAGVPVLDRLWPGRPREAGTLLLAVRGDAGGPDGQVVLADLRDGAALEQTIRAQQARLAEVAAENAALESQRQAAATALAEATRAVARAKARLGAVEAELAPLRRQRDQLLAQQRRSDAECELERERAARRQAQPGATKGKER